MNPSPDPPRSEPLTAILCRGCGFDLRAHGCGSRCPECGRTTYDTATSATDRGPTSAWDSGPGLLKLSSMLAAIPLSGIFLIAWLGSALAVVAIFGGLFHLASTWAFRRSALAQLDEAAPWRRYSWVAWFEVALGIAVIGLFLDPIAIAGGTSETLWLPLAAAWAVIAGARLAAICLKASSVLGAYGLSGTVLLQRLSAGMAIVAGIGVASSMLTARYLAGGTTTFGPMIALGVLVLFSLLGIAACWATVACAGRVEGNLLFDLVNRRIEDRDEALRAGVPRLPLSSKEDLAPLPLEGDEPT